MSTNNNIATLPIAQLDYYITPPHTCSYLPHTEARMVFIDPAQYIDEFSFSELSRVGFRRSGDFIYRPECTGCRQCLSCRVVVNRFVPSSRHKKAFKRNQDLVMRVRPTKDYQPEHYQLYERYINQRHQDGDMYPPSIQQFEKFLINSCTNSVFLEYWLDDQLLCVSAYDHLDDGISAVYTFFDPDQHRRSLGVFAILKQIEYAQNMDLEYVYLGYWVPHSAKMNYKIQYTPLEILIEGHWQLFEQPCSTQETEALGLRLIDRSKYKI